MIGEQIDNNEVFDVLINRKILTKDPTYKEKINSTEECMNLCKRHADCNIAQYDTLEKQCSIYRPNKEDSTDSYIKLTNGEYLKYKNSNFDITYNEKYNIDDKLCFTKCDDDGACSGLTIHDDVCYKNYYHAVNPNTNSIVKKYKYI